MDTNVGVWHRQYDLPRYGLADKEPGTRDLWTVTPIYGHVTVQHVPGSMLRTHEASGRAAYMTGSDSLYHARNQ